MLSKEEVEQLYKHRARVVSGGGSLYLKLPDATEFVQTCEENNLAILGIEGHFYRDGFIYGRIDMIADYSPSPDLWGQVPARWEEFRRRCNESALKFLSHLEPRDDLVVVFGVWSKEQWKSDMARNP